LRTGPTFTQGLFLRPKVSSVEEIRSSWRRPRTRRTEKRLLHRYLPTTEKKAGATPARNRMYSYFMLDLLGVSATRRAECVRRSALTMDFEVASPRFYAALEKRGTIVFPTAQVGLAAPEGRDLEKRSSIELRTRAETVPYGASLRSLHGPHITENRLFRSPFGVGAIGGAAGHSNCGSGCTRSIRSGRRDGCRFAACRRVVRSFRWLVCATGQEIIDA